MGKWCLQASSFIFDLIKLAGNQDRHKLSDQAGPDQALRSNMPLREGRLNFQETYYGITKISWPILIKFYMYHQWDGGKAVFRFWSRFHQNCYCHGNRKLPLTYNGENDDSMLTPSDLIRSLSNLQVTRTGIKSWMSSNFGQIGPLPLE